MKELFYTIRGLFCKGRLFGFLHHKVQRSFGNAGIFYICKYCLKCAKTEAEFDKFFDGGWVSDSWRVKN